MESKVIYNMFNTLFPILYVWCTPLLANIGFCNKNKSLLGNTLSNYIATPQATGMMAVSYYSVSNIMMSKRFYRAFAVPSGAEKGFYISGIFYEIFFGMFLCSPVTYYPTIHCIAGEIITSGKSELTLLLINLHQLWLILEDLEHHQLHLDMAIHALFSQTDHSGVGA